jgi:hypothetical protein
MALDKFITYLTWKMRKSSTTFCYFLFKDVKIAFHQKSPDLVILLPVRVSCFAVSDMQCPASLVVVFDLLLPADSMSFLFLLPLDNHHIFISCFSTNCLWLHLKNLSSARLFDFFHCGKLILFFPTFGLWLSIKNCFLQGDSWVCIQKPVVTYDVVNCYRKAVCPNLLCSVAKWIFFD